MGFTVRPDLHVEQVDTGYLVHRPGDDRVLHLTGAQADAFAAAMTGTVEVPDALLAPMAGLVELGLVDADGWTRRRALALGGAAAAAAVTAVALPGIAAADSHPGGGPTTTPGDTTTSSTSTSTSTTTTTPPRQTSLYVSSYNDHHVYKWPGSGTGVTTGVPDYQQGPAGLAVGPDGKLYIANTFNDTVRVWDGTSSTSEAVIGGGDLNEPFSLAFDAAGTLYIGCLDDTVHTWTIGSGPSTTKVIDTGLDNPNGLAVGPSGDLYIANGSGSTVSRWHPGSGTTATPFLTGLTLPHAVTFGPDGTLYIGDSGASRIMASDESGTTPSLVTGGINSPMALVCDASSNLFITTGYSTVVRWDGSGVSTIIETGLYAPYGITFF